MFDPNNYFNAVFIIPILNILIALYKLLLIVKVPGALGFALILLTVIVRLLLYPMTMSQLRNVQKLSKLKPGLDKITAKYKHDKTKLHQEQLNLYKQAGVNPAAGCLPLLLQMPILIALYNLFFQILTGSNLSQIIEEINKVVYFSFLKISSLELSFFGFNLAYKPSEWQKYGIWLLLIPVATAVLQYWQTKMMMPVAASVKTPQSDISQKQQEASSFKKEKKEEEDMSTVMQKQMSVMMPIMIGFFAYSFPLGLSLYWNTFTIFGIIQQHQLNRQVNKEDEENKI
ncbi:YidC/Oxa1 family membrane protein insertase [Candidatus Gottesmanbacteria bacterium]|nr:YidC/Oxa1 family membrane protein insertase [Candidatus Gottesmanbacteria bacterium]